MSSRGFAQRFAGLLDADAAIGPWRNSLAAIPRPTDTTTVRKVRELLRRNVSHGHPAIVCGNAERDQEHLSSIDR
jgi:hypothetical protein